MAVSTEELIRKLTTVMLERPTYRSNPYRCSIHPYNTRIGDMYLENFMSSCFSQFIKVDLTGNLIEIPSLALVSPIVKNALFSRCNSEVDSLIVPLSRYNTYYFKGEKTTLAGILLNCKEAYHGNYGFNLNMLVANDYSVYVSKGAIFDIDYTPLFLVTHVGTKNICRTLNYIDHADNSDFLECRVYVSNRVVQDANANLIYKIIWKRIIPDILSIDDDTYFVDIGYNGKRDVKIIVEDTSHFISHPNPWIFGDTSNEKINEFALHRFNNYLNLCTPY